ncbi:MAG: hypothetical protein RBS77_01890 [Candidatus Moranbacteria bacterium]|nr:hypothetical protein [Candidatus Moranbacteria bacterium]
MREKAKNNLQKLKNELRAEGLYLAVYLENRHPQLVITNIDPRKNEGTKALCFFLFPFFIPNDDSGTIATPSIMTNLTIYSLDRKIQGIQDGLYKRISSNILKGKIKALKRLSNNKN